MNEVEATLILCAAAPQKVMDAITALPVIAGYPLQPQDPVAIHDYYVDTSEDALRRSHFSLRLRQTNASSWLTLKGPPKRLSPGIEELLELELPWSRESLERISEELARQGIPIPAPPVSQLPSAPHETLSSIGLKFIQHRENHRQVRNVMPRADLSGPRLAELSVDLVTYHLAGRQVRHYEVEIEAKSEAGIPALSIITQALVDTYPTALQRWDHGKLSIGRAVAALLQQGDSPDLLNDQDQLTPQAYQKIDQFLRE